MARTPEQRRLNSLLADPEYGAMLARLNRSDEREILDLISAGRGREARKRLAELDANRRRGSRVKQKVRKYLELAPEERKGETWKALNKQELSDIRLFWKLYKEQAAGGAPMKTPEVPQPKPMTVERRIRLAYKAISPDSRWVQLSTLRAYLPDISRPDMDAELERMSLMHGVILSPAIDQNSLTVENRRAGLKLGMNTMHVIMIRDDI